MAVLEQWEIDLRNQLLEGSESQKEWEERLRQDLKGIPPRKKKKERVQTTPAPAPEPIHKKKKQESLLGYYVIILLLIVMGLFVYNQKSGGALTNWFANRIQFTESEKKTPEVRPDAGPMPLDNNSGDITQLKLDMAKMKQDMETMNSKLKWNSDRITLMGMLLNENFVILGNGYDCSDLIFFNSDWTINKMPRYLQIQEKDREYLQKFVKPAQ
jgi:hypothetical protein